MKIIPSVTIITPTTPDREQFNTRIAHLMKMQDYDGPIEHLFNYSDAKIGEKRNELCARAVGDIIIHADSDDIYARDWVSKCVKYLLASDALLIGLSSCYLSDLAKKAYYYEFNINLPPRKPYVLGATMCYYRHHWEKHPFNNMMTGEDFHFSMDCPKVKSHDYVNGFIAVLHDNNISSGKQVMNREFSPIPVDIVKKNVEFINAQYSTNNH